MKIEIKGVSKRFRETTALEGVSISLKDHHIYGLLGRNGAGKSTLFNLITGRLFPTEGTVLVDGEPVWENDRALGKIYFMSESDYFPAGMRVRDIYRYTSDFYPGFDMTYALKLSDEFELNLDAKCSRLSTGYGTILKLTAALASGAPAVLLDEPVLGLDAVSRELFYRELVQNFAENPRLIVFSTHLIQEASKLIDCAVILKRGKLILAEDVESLLENCYLVRGPAETADRYSEGKAVIGSESLGGLKTVYLRGRPGQEGLPPELEAGKMDLQKLFIELTGHTREEDLK